MANIYVGFHDQRSSSRVLKPPGGGSSDIFGTNEVKVKPEEVKSAPSTPSKDSSETKNQNVVDAKPETNGVANAKQEVREQSVPVEVKIENLNIREENYVEKQEVYSSEPRATSKPDTISSIIRQSDRVQEEEQSPAPVVESENKKTPQRVPPGGFSSGLW